MDKPCQKRHQQLTTAGCIIGSTVLVRRHAFILCAHVQDAVAVDLEGHLDGKNQGFDFWQDWQPTNNGLVCWGKSSPKFPWIFPWRSWGFPAKVPLNQSIDKFYRAQGYELVASDLVSPCFNTHMASDARVSGHRINHDTTPCLVVISTKEGTQNHTQSLLIMVQTRSSRPSTLPATYIASAWPT